MKGLAARVLALAMLLLVGRSVPARAGDVDADVVVLVDTSSSIDPYRRQATLVARLLSDVLPGRLAVGYLPDVGPGQARAHLAGLVERPKRGDAAYKAALESHLQYASDGSRFERGFGAAQGYFEQRATSSNRHLIWLTDAESSSSHDVVRASVESVQALGVDVRGVIFGGTPPWTVRDQGVSRSESVASPQDLMRAFADQLRAVLGAPYRQDGSVAAQPRFEIKRDVSEAWVVIYSSDVALPQAEVTSPAGEQFGADFAHDALVGAGAYRVAHLLDPAPGVWGIAIGGAPRDAAFAVVQLVDLELKLLEPGSVAPGEQSPIVAGFLDSRGAVSDDPELLSGMSVVAMVDGQRVELRDDGTNGDAKAGDGRFSGLHQFDAQSTVDVELRGTNDLVDLRARATVAVGGGFHSSGASFDVDFGTQLRGQETCRPLDLPAEHEGQLRFVLEAARSLPEGLRLEVRGAGKTLSPGSAPERIGASDPVEACLVSSPDASRSTSSAEHWVTLRWLDGQGATAEVPIRASWAVVEVEGSFVHHGGPARVDLGKLAHGEESCAALTADTSQDRALMFRLDLREVLPPGLRLEVRGPGAPLVAGGGAVEIAPAAPLSVCLIAADDAPGSVSLDGPWVTLRWIHGDGEASGVPILVSWDVKGAPWWVRWRRVLLGVLAALVTSFVTYGFIYPNRFPRGAGIAFALERSELDDVQATTPFRRWPGVRAGWYRHARGYVLPSYRMSNRRAGSVALVRMTTRRRLEITPTGGEVLRETSDGKWEAIDTRGTFVRTGDVFRAGGCYFRISLSSARSR